MLFWILCALLTSAVVLVVLRPLLRDDTDVAGRAEADAQVYQDQLAEIERDMDRGLIDPEEAEAAKIEISRRLLSAHDDIGKTGQEQVGKPLHAALVYGVAVAVVVGSLVGYMVLGSPGQPGTNHAARLKQDPRKAPISEQIARVEARLRAVPEDADGWEVIAPVYLRLGRNRDAANAFQQAIKLRGPSAARLSGFTRARLAMTNGVVAKDVKEALELLLRLRPKDVSTRFWLAMAKEQAGDKAAAARGYAALLEETTLSEQFRKLLRERLAAMGAPAAKPEDRPQASQPGAVPAPDRGTAEAIKALPEGERRKVIVGMVEGLASRLAKDGNDPEGWLRLIRAYVVLGEKQKAETALSNARKALAGREAELQQVEKLAAGLGLGS